MLFDSLLSAQRTSARDPLEGNTTLRKEAKRTFLRDPTILTGCFKPMSLPTQSPSSVSNPMLIIFRPSITTCASVCGICRTWEPHFSLCGTHFEPKLLPSY